MTRKGVRKLSELEGVCLGIVGRDQPCTAYRVRRALKRAPSSHWQASAGSVYPLLTRLETAGLVTATSDRDDGRGRRLLSVTPRGTKSLRAWILAGTDRELIASVTDPIRSRTFFLGTLGGSLQLQFVDDLLAQVERYLAETRAHLESQPMDEDLYEYLGNLGAMHLTEARLGWLRIVRKRLANPNRQG